MRSDVQAIANNLRRRQAALAATKDRLSSQAGRVHTISGLFYVMGTGEATQEIKFPVRYVERPVCTFGAEVAPDSNITDGGFPTYSVTVGGWELEEINAAQILYVGATLFIVTAGAIGQNLWIHWSARGRAITSPYSITPNTDSIV